MPLLPKKEKLYTVEDIYSLPEGVRAELVEGHIFQKIVLKAVYHVAILLFFV